VGNCCRGRWFQADREAGNCGDEGSMEESQESNGGDGREREVRKERAEVRVSECELVSL